MTRISKITAKTPSRAWGLAEAKARFSEVVRLAHSEGPQLVSVHGRNPVMVISAQAYARMQGGRMGDALIAVMQAAPLAEEDLEPIGMRMPVRDVLL